MSSFLRDGRKWGATGSAAIAAGVIFVSGCGHHRPTVSQAPPMAPPVAESNIPPPRFPPAESTIPTTRIPPTPVPPGGVTEEDIHFVNTHPPLLTEVGLATWYSAPYKGRRAANGEVFDDNALTAAHRTLPMGSLVGATNLTTGQWAAMGISDGGPFVAWRLGDLTMSWA